MKQIDLNDLRSEYESTYLYYVNKKEEYLSFEEWLKKNKEITIKDKKKKSKL